MQQITVVPALQSHSHVGQSAYHDLRRLLLEHGVAELRGTPTRVISRGRAFWYDKYRVGHEMRQHYIGPDSVDLRERIARIEELKAARELRRKEQTRLVRLLRAEGYASTDVRTGSLLAAFSNAGVFRLGGTLVGTVAFRHYEGELGVAQTVEHLAQTGDIDIASFERLSFAIGDHVDTPLADVFGDFKFRPVPSLERGKVWRWEQASSGTLVEFLMPAQRDEGIRELPALGVSAQALRHLDYLIEDPIPAVSLYRSGVLIQIPRPERFAIHKLIVAERRRDGPDALKARKDRAQAALLVEVLAEVRPDELLDAYENALARGPQWRNRVQAALRRLPETERLLAKLCT